jgi:hypothetical protein
MLKRVRDHAETSLWTCGDSAYHNFRVEVQAERDRCYRWLSQMGQENLHEAKMKKFLEFLVNQEFKFLAAAFRPWKELVVRQEEHEVESAAVEVQRVVRSFLLRQREALTERGLQVHYVKVKCMKSALAQKEKERLIRNGDGFALVGMMTLEKTEEVRMDEG